MSADHLVDCVGYGAAALVLATFSARSMSKLRLVAIASNLAFIAYGYLAGLAPVLVLHAVLLPINVHRWTQLREARAGSTAFAGEAARRHEPS